MNVIIIGTHCLGYIHKNTQEKNNCLRSKCFKYRYEVHEHTVYYVRIQYIPLRIILVMLYVTQNSSKASHFIFSAQHFTSKESDTEVSEQQEII